MARDAYKYFRIEARELHEQLAQGALDIEKGAAPASVVPRLLRLAHTLKGAARVVKHGDIAEAAHAIEDALAPWRDGAERVPREPIDAVLAQVDRIAAQVAALTPTAGTPGPSALVPEEALRTVRADVAEMDALLEGVAETHAQVALLRRRFASLARARSLADRLQEQLARPGPSGGARGIAQELQALLGGLEHGLASSTDQMDRELRQLRDTAEQLRLVPAGSLFTPLELTARDAAQSLGKRVAFEGHGGDVRLDAHVLAGVQGALLQLVRNAVAHGIEPPAQRQAAGKPPDGRLTLDVVRRGRCVVFRCSDDGAGVDLAAVRRVAERKGLLAATAQALDAQGLLTLMLRGGLSTSGSVTEVSGRGIGLDVVRDAAERLGGEIAAHTESGRGTTLELTVPLSLASLNALLVEVAGTPVAIPLDAVRRTLRLSVQQIAATAQGRTVVYEDRAIPFVALSALLAETPPPSSARAMSVVIVEGGGALAAIGVERLLSTSKLVLRPLPELVPASPLVAGASLDAEGNPQLVLDPEGLVLAAGRAAAVPAPAVRAAAPVLVIDDSLTTRMLEKSILESAGYEVDLATSAIEALGMARAQPFRLFLVDVEMPGMDGFSFIQEAAADPRIRDVPAILVSSRSSPEDRRRGEEVGARAYIAKNEFDQARLLET
ncbi:hybrid sensor histidine kinase/response regulator, partial [Piscinibacter sp.]|uniref:hybrid sensor histidine kinase/response regulator n=1 Tax=Piscinibacter sp. TaxID=1903157 RepID=UPI002D0F6C9C